MKNLIFIFLLLLSFTAVAQTPFDSFDAEMAKIPINKSETYRFRLINTDTTHTVRLMILDIDSKTLELYGKNEKLIAIKPLKEGDKKFYSADPLTKDYPFLTPYQFASNSPISGIDLDGLEFFYAADGNYLGKYGNDTRVFVVNAGDISKAQKAIASGNIYQFQGIKAQELTWNGQSITNFEFEQYAAIIHNETFGSKEEDKQIIADAVFNKRDGLKDDYPIFKKKTPTLQQAMDKVAYGKDTHEQRMSEKRRNPTSEDVIPNTEIPLSKIREKNYQDYMNTDIELRNQSTEMKTNIKVVINSLLRDNGSRTEDKANKKHHWIGDGKTHKLY